MNDTPEYFTISALIKFPELADDLRLKPEMFYDTHYRNVIKFINKQHGLDVNELFYQAKKFEDKFIPSELIKKMRNDPYVMKTHFNQYQLEVLEHYKAVTLSDATKAYTEQPTQKNLKYMQDVMTLLDDLQIVKHDSKNQSIEQIMDEIYQQTKPKLMPTGFESIDQLIGGFEEGQLVVIGARPSAGKTALALNIGIEMEKRNCNVAVFSLETTVKKIGQRIVSSLSRVNLTKFKYPDSLSQDELLKITDSLDVYQKMNIRVNDDSNVTPADIRRTASKMQREGTNNVIIIDYLTLMKSDKKLNDRRLEVEDISRQLKIIAKEFKCVIIALSQLSRGVESRNDKRPMMSDLREAGGIEQDADMIFLLYRDDYYNKPEEYDHAGKSVVECIVAKNKDGEVGTAKLDFYKPIQRFYG